MESDNNIDYTNNCNSNKGNIKKYNHIYLMIRGKL